MNTSIADIIASVEAYKGVTLVAVSKTVGVGEIRQAYNLGLRHFGESRVQDALSKLEALDLPITWHFIGRLQTNKVKKIAGRFDLIHSLSSLHLAEELSRVAVTTGNVFKCLVQVNASFEATKQGFDPQDVAPFLEQVKALPGVKIQGLMTMGPNTDEKERIQQSFREVRLLYEELTRNPVGDAKMQYLSMGMSGDYHIALAEGSNMVRIGTAIFTNLNRNGGESHG